MSEEGYSEEYLEPRHKETSSKAILSLVLSILGITCFWIFSGIPAIILGVLARRDIRESGGGMSGNGMALSGLILGCISLIVSCPLWYGAMMVAVAVPNFYEAQTRAKVAKAKSEIRNLAVALETYYMDNNNYPPTLYNLTTPIDYLTTIPQDPFATGPVYDYATDYDSMWILRSLGPNESPDATLPEALRLIDEMEDWQWHGQSWLYDPTNGTNSSGDVMRRGP